MKTVNALKVLLNERGPSQHGREFDSSNACRILNLIVRLRPPRPAVKNRETRCLHDDGSLLLQPAPWLRYVFTRRGEARLPSASRRRQRVLIYRATLSACLMRSSNSLIRVSFRRRTAA